MHTLSYYLQDMFCAIGVCKSWRAAGHALFFKDSWGAGVQTASGPAIQHPAQLITLVRYASTAINAV
jgi:hypothetical protein